MDNINQILDIRKNNYNIHKMVEMIEIVPFVGAGMSCPCFPTWRELLQSFNLNLQEKEQLNNYINTGMFEEAASFINSLSNFDFEQTIREKLADNKIDLKRISIACYKIPQVASNLVITTNLDNVIPKIYLQNNEQINIITPLQKDQMDDAINQRKKFLIKLHGDIENPSTYIVTKEQYNNAYGSDDKFVKTKTSFTSLLYRLMLSKTLLFLGCSLTSDRTLRVLRYIKEHEGFHNIHYSIMELSENEEENNSLERRLGDNYNIAVIWIPKGQYSAIETILQYYLAEKQKTTKDEMVISEDTNHDIKENNHPKFVFEFHIINPADKAYKYYIDTHSTYQLTKIPLKRQVKKEKTNENKTVFVSIAYTGKIFNINSNTVQYANLQIYNYLLVTNQKSIQRVYRIKNSYFSDMTFHFSENCFVIDQPANKLDDFINKLNNNLTFKQAKLTAYEIVYFHVEYIDVNNKKGVYDKIKTRGNSYNLDDVRKQDTEEYEINVRSFETKSVKTEIERFIKILFNGYKNNVSSNIQKNKLLEESYSLYLNKDYKKIFHILELDEIKTNPIALTNLGFLYAHGYGTEINIEKALQLYNQAKTEDAKLNKLALLIATNKPVLQNERESENSIISISGKSKELESPTLYANDAQILEIIDELLMNGNKVFWDYICLCKYNKHFAQIVAENPSITDNITVQINDLEKIELIDTKSYSNPPINEPFHKYKFIDSYYNASTICSSPSFVYEIYQLKYLSVIDRFLKTV